MRTDKWKAMMRAKKTGADRKGGTPWKPTKKETTGSCRAASLGLTPARLWRLFEEARQAIYGGRRMSWREAITHAGAIKTAYTYVVKRLRA